MTSPVSPVLGTGNPFASSLDVADALPHASCSSLHASVSDVRMDGPLANVDHVAATVASGSAPGVVTIVHPYADGRIEAQDPSWSLQTSTLALLAFTIVLWPLSLPPLLLALGWTRTSKLLTNLGYSWWHPWDAPRSEVEERTLKVGWTQSRRGLLLVHHGTTVMFICAVVLWAVSPAPDRSASPTDAARVTSAMLSFQLLSTLAMLIARRFSLAIFTLASFVLSPKACMLMRDVTRRLLPPLLLPLAPMPRASASGLLQMLSWHEMVLAIYSRLSTPPPIICSHLRAPVHDLLCTVPGAWTMVASPQAALLAALPQRSLRLQDGRVAARLVAPPSFRSRFLAALDLGDVPNAEPRAPVSKIRDNCSNVADCDVVQDFAAVVPAMYFSPTRIRETVWVFIVCSAMALVGCVLPMVLRRFLLGVGYLMGSNPVEASSFLLLMAVEMCLLASPRTNGLQFVFTVYNNTLHGVSSLASMCDSRSGSNPVVPRADVIQAQSVDNCKVRVVSMSMDRFEAEGVDSATQALLTEYVTHIRERRLHGQVTAIDARAVRGACVLDSVTAVTAAQAQLHVLCRSAASSQGGLSHRNGLLGAFTPTISIILSATLAVAFSVSTDLISSLHPNANKDSVRVAALVPTVVMLISFCTNCGVLLLGFRRAGQILSELKNILHSVMHAMQAMTRVLDTCAQQRSRLLLMIADAECDDARELRRSLAVCEGEIGEISAVLEAQRTLIDYLTQQLHDAAGIRFLGVFRPGAATISGFVALIASCSVLAIRLVSALYGTDVLK